MITEALSAPGQIRTADFWLRRPTLYPAELREQFSEQYELNLNLILTQRLSITTVNKSP